MPAPDTAALLRAELLALRTVRTGWWPVPVAAALTLWAAVDPVVGAGRSGSPSLGTAGALLAVLAAAGRGALVALAAGAVLVTSDVRHRTLTPLLLCAPRRTALLTAKAAVAVLVGTAVAVVDLLVVLAVAGASGAADPALLNADVVLRVAGLLLACPVYALLGVGIGALLVSQPLAVGLAVAWGTFLEGLVVPASLSRWSLSGATAGLANSGDTAGVLPVVAGGAVVLAYAAAALGLGGVRLLRRDLV